MRIIGSCQQPPPRFVLFEDIAKRCLALSLTSKPQKNCGPTVPPHGLLCKVAFSLLASLDIACRTHWSIVGRVMCMWLGSPCRYCISDLWKWWVYSNLKIKHTVNSWFYVFHCFFLNLDLSFIQMDLDSWPHNWDRVCSPEIHVWLGLALLQPIISGLLDAIRESWKGETWKCNEDHRKHEFDSLYAFSVGLGNHLYNYTFAGADCFEASKIAAKLWREGCLGGRFMLDHVVAAFLVEPAALLVAMAWFRI